MIKLTFKDANLIVKNRRDMWFKSILRSLKRFLHQCYHQAATRDGSAAMLYDKTQIQAFSHQFSETVTAAHQLDDEQTTQIIGFLEYTLMPKYTVGMMNKHKARNLINKYQQTLASYSQKKLERLIINPVFKWILEALLQQPVLERLVNEDTLLQKQKLTYYKYAQLVRYMISYYQNH